MNKKGQIVMALLVGVLAVILIAYLLIPMVKQSTDEQITSESLVKSGNYTIGQNITLSDIPLDNSTLRIEGLSTGSNYTLLSADTGVIYFTNAENNTYTAYYSYYHTSYLDGAGERSLFAVVIIAGIIGLLYYLFKATGIIDS